MRPSRSRGIGLRSVEGPAQSRDGSRRTSCKNPTAVLSELQRRVQSDPAPFVFAQLAEEYCRAGRHADAVACCRTGLDRHPGYLTARLILGRALVALARWDEAADAYLTVVNAAPDNLAATRELAEIYDRQGRVADALQFYRRALALARNDKSLEAAIAALSAGGLAADVGSLTDRSLRRRRRAACARRLRCGARLTRPSRSTAATRHRTAVDAIPRRSCAADGGASAVGTPLPGMMPSAGSSGTCAPASATSSFPAPAREPCPSRSSRRRSTGSRLRLMPRSSPISKPGSMPSRAIGPQHPRPDANRTARHSCRAPDGVERRVGRARRWTPSS